MLIQSLLLIPALLFSSAARAAEPERRTVNLLDRASGYRYQMLLTPIPPERIWGTMTRQDNKRYKSSLNGRCEWEFSSKDGTPIERIAGPGRMTFNKGSDYTKNEYCEKLVLTGTFSEKEGGPKGTWSFSAVGELSKDGRKIYEGALEDFDFRGQGTWFFANGDKYSAGFSGLLYDPRTSGKGVYTFADGRAEPRSYARPTSPDEVSEGPYSDAQEIPYFTADGKAAMEVPLKKGDCKFINDIYDYTNGVYKGECRNGLAHGAGRAWAGEGIDPKDKRSQKYYAYYAGYWVNGKLRGRAQRVGVSTSDGRVDGFRSLTCFFEGPKKTGRNCEEWRNFDPKAPPDFTGGYWNDLYQGKCRIIYANSDSVLSGYYLLGQPFGPEITEDLTGTHPELNVTRTDDAGVQTEMALDPAAKKKADNERRLADAAYDHDKALRLLSEGDCHPAIGWAKGAVETAPEFPEYAETQARAEKCDARNRAEEAASTERNQHGKDTTLSDALGKIGGAINSAASNEAVRVRQQNLDRAGNRPETGSGRESLKRNKERLKELKGQ